MKAVTVGHLADLMRRCHANPAPLTAWEAGFLDDLVRRGHAPTPKQVATLERIASRLTPAEVAARLADRIESVATELAGDEPTDKGRIEWRFRSKGSLAVVVNGEHRGSFRDYESGARGDALELVRALRGCTLAEAMKWALGRLGEGAAPTGDMSRRQDISASRRREVPYPKPARDTVDLARQVWAGATPAQGTPAETYLASRGLSLPAGAPLRFQPACYHGPTKGRLPAMVALMTDATTGRACGVHRTFLAPDGRGKAAVPSAKMMLGRAGVIRLAPDTEVTLGLGIAEGIETALAVTQRAGWQPVWAACSAGAISTFPVLGGIEAVTVFADRDDKGAGLAAARACAGRWRAAGCEAVVRLPPVGTDWQDALIGRAA